MKIKGVFFVAAFVGLLLLAFCKESDAQVAIESGPTFLSGDYSKGAALILSERFANKYEIHVGYVSEQFVQTCNRDDCKFHLKENIFFGAQRITGWNRLKLGVGMDYWQNTNRALGEPLTFSLLLEYRIGAHISVRLRHMSNAGSGSPNLGQDMLTVGWSY